MSNEFDAAVAASLQPDQGQAARVGFSVAADTDPDAYAEAQRVARRTGVPVDTVMNMPKEMKRQDAMGTIDFDALAKTSPATASLLADVELAKIAHDDVENMGVIETLVNSFRRGIPALKSILPSITMVNQATGLDMYRKIDERIAAGEDPKKVLADYGDYGLAPLPWQTSEQALAGWNSWKAKAVPKMQGDIGESATDVARLQAERAAIPLPGVVNRTMTAKTWGGAFGEIASDPVRFVAAIGPESLIQSAPGLVAAIPAGFAAGPGGSAATIGANSFIVDYASTLTEAMQSAGIDTSDPDAIRVALKNPEILTKITDHAVNHASVVGAFDALSGGIAGKMLLPKKIAGKLASRPLAQEMANIALQVPIQGALGGLGELGGEINAGQEIQPGNVLAEVFGEFFGTPSEVVSASAKRINERIGQVRQAEQDAQIIGKLNELAKASKVLQRDPQTFQQFVAKAAESGESTVFIDANTLMQSGVAEQVMQASPAAAEQLVNATATGGSVAIPIDDYLTNIAPTEAGKLFEDHGYLQSEGFSRFEAQDFMQNYAEELRADVERTLAEKQGDDTFKASAEAVRNEIRTQLDTAARFTPQVNDAYSAMVGNFYAVTAAKLGTTPEELFAKYPLRVQAESVAGGQTYGQGETLDDIRQLWDSEGIAHDISEKKGVITLGKIVVPDAERKSGKGTAAMQSLVDYADRTGQRIELGASSQLGGDKARLVEFYERFGFKRKPRSAPINKPFKDTAMFRDPQKLAQSAVNPENSQKYTSDTINIDGVDRPTTNSNGKPIAQTEEGLRNFWRWFGDSKVVDANGEPLLMYHGTSIDKDFTKFKVGARGAWFSSSNEVASDYAEDNDSQADKYNPDTRRYEKVNSASRVMPVYLKIENPYRMTADDARRVNVGNYAKAQRDLFAEIRAKGYDGILWNDNLAKEWVVLGGPEQIKSATGNSGTFDPNDPNILHQFAGQSSATADTHALATAQDRLNAGEDAETVRQETGWFKGNDGKWRYEISDADAKFIGKDSMEQAAEADPYKVAEIPLGDVLDHPALFAAYPKLRSVMVAYEATSAAAGDLYFGASYNSADNTISLGNGLTNEQMASALLHEIQHGIQTIEGFATGGSLEIAGIVKAQAKREWDHWSNAYTIKREMEEAGHSLDEAVAALNDLDFGINADQIADAQRYTMAELKAKNDAAYAELQRTGDGPRSTYLKIAGEVEARNTQARADLTDEQRRATPPGATADTADQDVILVFNGKEMEHAPAIANAFEQTARGAFNPASLSITLLKNADLSTFLHESGHFFLEVQADIASKLQQEAEIFGMDTLKPGERQILADTDALLRWFGVRDLAEWHNLDFEEKRSYHEQFARGFEAYLFEGKAPSIELQGLFQRFRAWLLSVYRELKALNVELTDEVRGVFDRLLATNEQIALAEQGRSMMPLFTSPEQAGMTPEEFAAYQALGVDATAQAIEDLQARGLRDMRWLHNARGRIIKKLQRDAKEQRAAVEMDVRREVMSQPLYRAWQFLTAKQTREDMLDSEKARADYREALSVWNAARNAAETEARKDAKQEAWAASEEGRKKYRKDGSLVKAQQRVLKREEKAIEDEVQKVVAEWEAKNRKPADPDARPKSSPDVVDETRDSLFAAIGKLGGIDKAEAVGTWGIDPADKPASGVFGKPVWRREGGLSIDGMAEALSQYGYLTLDENGKWDIRELEEKFRAELGGDVQVSNTYDYAADQQQDETISNPGGLTAGRLDMQALATMGLPVEAVNAIKARKMTAKAGLHPDIVAELFGFTSGDELVRKLAAAETPRAEIDALTDVRMLEQFGDLSSPQAIEKAADKAIHNDARARFVATEANALERATGQRKTLASAARMYAEQIVARLKIRNIKPGQYANAEVRAAKAAEKASKAGDLATAAAEKRNQLIQNYATRAAYDAQENVDRGLRYLKKFEGDIKGLDADYAEQIGNLLERFDLRKGQSNKAVDKRTALAEWIKAQREAGLEPDIPPELENEAFRTSYKNLTVEEFRGLVDSVRQIEHLGRLKHKLLTAADQRAYEAVRDEIAGSIRENAQGRQADTRTPTTNMGRALQGLKRFWASHIKAATWARVMDGGKDGGHMWEYFVRSANERGDQETTMRAEATAKLSEILAPVFKLGKMGGKGQFFPSIGRSLNREARLAIALNMGNAGNIQRLLGGEGWTMAQLTPVLQSLTAQEWQAVQAVWDHFESYRPQIAEKERRVYGKEPDWVEPQPFAVTTADGSTVTLRGGYYPIKYDPAASQRAEEHADAESAQRQLQGAYTTATTRRSFTKARVEEVSGRPLLYTLAGMYSGVNDVIHDLAWHEWLIDANRLLRSHTIDTAIREHYGPEAKQQFKTWVQDVAEGDKGAANAGEAALGRLRQGVSASGLGFNVMSAAIQITGFNQSIVRVGAPWIGRGIAKYLGNPLGLTRTVHEMSDFMANRARTRFRELNELRNRVQDQSTFNEFVGRYAYFMMMRVQQVVDVPTWWGAYEKAIAAGNEETRAVALADQAVIDAQGGGQTKDLSAIERGGPALRLFTVFYSFMNTALNLGVAQTMGANTPAKRAKLAVDYLMLYTVPAVLGYTLKAALTPGDSGDDDLEEIAKKLAAEQLGYLMGLMVVVREFNEVAKMVTGNPSFGYSGPAGLRGITDAQKFGQQAMQGEFDDAFRKSAVNLIGDFTGLPAAQINRTITGTQALAEGKTENPAAVAFGFQEPR